MLFIIYRREIQNGRSLRTVEPFFRLHNGVYINSFYVFFHKNLNIIDFTKERNMSHAVNVSTENNFTYGNVRNRVL